MEKAEVRSYKFSTTASEVCPEILCGKTPKQFLKDKYQRGLIFGLEHLKKSGIYKEAGWIFDFKPYLKKFIVEQYGCLEKEYAPNKTAIRNSTYGVIDAIYEI